MYCSNGVMLNGDTALNGVMAAAAFKKENYGRDNYSGNMAAAAPFKGF